MHVTYSAHFIAHPPHPFFPDIGDKKIAPHVVLTVLPYILQSCKILSTQTDTSYLPCTSSDNEGLQLTFGNTHPSAVSDLVFHSLIQLPK